MQKSNKEKNLLELLEAQAQQAGYDIVDLEVVGTSKAPCVRVRIDTLGDVPINLDEVAEATPWVSSVIEAADPFQDSYTLEVSSPGVDRPLRRKSDFERFLGSRAEVRTISSIDGGNRRACTGTIQEVSDQGVRIATEDEVFDLAFDDISKAHVIAELDFTKKEKN